MLDTSDIRKRVVEVARSYPVKRIDLFGSYADETQTEQSDVDLLVEFDTPNVSLFTLTGLKIGIEESLGTDVDLIHTPIPEDSMIEIGRTVPLYEA